MKALIENRVRSLNLKYRMLYRRRWERLYSFGLRVYEAFLGRKIRLDASSVCQLKCPACSTASGMNKAGVVGWGHLRPENFRRLLEENPNLRTIELSNWGEIFLNPGIDEIVRIGHDRGVTLMAANGVNLNTVREETLENLVRCRFSFLSVSIDGASPETYEKYRVRGDFDTVVANIRRINHYKQKHNSSLPVLQWQFVIFGHNEHELPRARALARELGMKFRTKLNHTPTVAPVKDEALVRREGGFGAASREEYRKKTKQEYSFPCSQMWDNPQVNWDGKLLGCCVNKFGDFGNIFSEGLEGALRGERYVYAKQMVLGKAPPRRDIPCFGCNTYWRMFPEWKEVMDGERARRAKQRAEKESRRARKTAKVERQRLRAAATETEERHASSE